jgi:primase-polymerase (primpol)-like protein
MSAKTSPHLQFPAELIRRNQWCVWRIEPDEKGHPTKVPYRPDGRKASSKDPRTWSTFSAVTDSLTRKPEYLGAGYFLAADDPICGVDLDVCLDANGAPYSWAAEIIPRFQNTYRARSVSGYGLHVLCLAVLPDTGRNFNVPNGPTNPSGKRAQIGLFDRGRLFALTGKVYQRSPQILADHQETIDWLLGMMPRRRRTAPGEPRPMTNNLLDSEIIERAHGAKNGAKFGKLWGGQWQSDYGSQSEADMALCCMLAFWCGPDPARIETLFGQSGLVRKKWTGREDYRQHTIEAAIESISEFYDPTRLWSGPAAKASSASDTAGAKIEVRVGARQLQEMSGQALAAPKPRIIRQSCSSEAAGWWPSSKTSTTDTSLQKSPKPPFEAACPEAPSTIS